MKYLRRVWVTVNAFIWVMMLWTAITTDINKPSQPMSEVKARAFLVVTAIIALSGVVVACREVYESLNESQNEPEA